MVPPESIAYLVLGGFVALFSMLLLPLKERLCINEVVLGTAFGIILGPYGVGVFDPHEWGSTLGEQNRITLEFMRVVLAIGLFAIGVELPDTYLADHARSLLLMVVPIMAFGWLIIAVIVQALFPALSYISALVITACLTPTDPVLAAAIVGGNFARKHVPVHVSHLLSAESAANDGLAYPFLSISIYLATESSLKVAFGKWFLIGWLYQVVMGTILGTFLGLAFSHLMKLGYRKGLVNRESFIAQYLALALLTIGIASIMGMDDLLAAFAAGCAVSWDGHFNMRTKDEAFSAVIEFFMNCACFLYIGAWIPFDTYFDATLGIQPWRLIVLFLVILAIRRIPFVFMLYKFVPDIHDWREAFICGHFGPMGVSAIFIATLALTELPRPSNPPASQNELLAASLHPIVSFVVLGSVIIHGLSIPAFLFGKRYIRIGLVTKVLRRSCSTESLLAVNYAATPERSDQNRPPQVIDDIERGEFNEGPSKETLGRCLKRKSARLNAPAWLINTPTTDTNQTSSGGGTIIAPENHEERPERDLIDL